MPAPTQTPNQDEHNPAKDVGQANVDDIVNKRFNPDPETQAAGDPSDPRGEGSDSLYGRETQAAGDPSDPRDIAQKESEGDSNWKTKVTASPEKSAPQKLRSFVGKKKRRGILASLALFIAILGIIGSLLSGAIGLVGLKETIFSKLTQRADNVLTHRMNRVMIKKMSQDLTTGCKVIKVKCRYKGMSTREVKKFNKRNMGNGVRLVTKPSNIPGRQQIVAMQTYELAEGATVSKDGSIKGKPIKSYEANELKTAFKNNPKIYKAGVTFYKSYVQYHSGNVARGMFKRLGVYLGKHKVSKSKGNNNIERLRSQQNSLIDKAQGNTDHTMSPSARKYFDELPDDVQQDINNRTNTLSDEGSDPKKVPTTPGPESPEFEKTYGRSAETIERQGSGFSFSSIFYPLRVILPYCTMRNLVQAGNQVRKIDQTIQILKFGMIFYTLADQVKAGDANGDSSETINVAMSMLTTKDKDGLTAFDSTGYNWITRGAIRPNHGEDVTKFQNGGSASGLLGTAVSATTSGLGPICAFVNSRIIIAAFAAGTLASLVAGFFTGGTATAAYGSLVAGGTAAARTFAKKLIDTVVTKGVTKLITKKISQKIEGQAKSKLAWKAIKHKLTRTTAITAFFLFGTGPLIEVIARSGSGTDTKGLEGPDAGNALVAAGGAENAKAGQAQGLELITADEAVGQDKVAVANNLRSAKSEGIDQLDPSNPYSFSNRFATALLPSMSSFGSVSSGFSELFSTALDSTVGNAQADSTKKLQYEYCRDDHYENADINIATDIFCNPQYGFDMSVIDGPEYDPEKVTDYVYDNGLVDQEGEPIGDFSGFISKCMETEASVGQDGEGNIESDCVKRDTKHRMMRIYCLDSSIDSDMKEEASSNCSTQDENLNNASANPAGSGAPETIDLATLYEPSDDIACADGTNDLGAQDGYHNGSKMKIKICEIPKDILPSTGQESHNEFGISGASGGAIVNSRVSKAVLEMAKAMKADDLPIVAACSSFRTMAHQQELYNADPSSGNVARPGFSNHQSGVALDLRVDNNSCGESSYGRERPNNSPHVVWDWLKENADKYSYKQLSFEFWHWSPDGG